MLTDIVRISRDLGHSNRSKSESTCPNCNSQTIISEQKHKKVITSFGIDRNKEGIPVRLNGHIDALYDDMHCETCGNYFTNWYAPNDSYVRFVQRTPF